VVGREAGPERKWKGLGPALSIASAATASRSSKVVDFDTNQSVYATVYSSSIVTLVLSYPVSEILQVNTGSG